MKVLANKVKILLSVLIVGTMVNFGISQQELPNSKLIFNLIEKKYDFSLGNEHILSLPALQENTNGILIKMPSAYKFEDLALFCKFEEKVAQNSNINMRFRLGSVDYVNYLEQKPFFTTKN